MPALKQTPRKPATYANTTDNTQTTLATFPTKSNKAYMINARIVGIKTNDFNLVAAYLLNAVVVNVGGTLRVVQSNVTDVFGGTSLGEDAGAAAAAATIDTSGTDIRIRVTAVNSVNTTWGCDLLNDGPLEVGQWYANFGEIG